MKLKTLLFILLFIIGYSIAGFSQGILTAVPALRVEPDPVTTGRGFTGVAQADRSTAVFWNPAGLAFQRGLQVGFSRFKWLPGLDDELSYNYLSGRYSLDGMGTLGGHITYLDLGSQSFRDSQGNSFGNFSSYELSVGASIGRVVIPKTLSLGLGIRFVSSRLVPPGTMVGTSEAKTGNSVGIDLGALYIPDEFEVMGYTSLPLVGISITNFGGRVSYSNSGFKNALPTLLRVGVANRIFFDDEQMNTLTPSLELSKFLVRADSAGAKPAFQSLFTSWGSYSYFDGQNEQTVSFGEQLMLGAGLEYWYDNLLALRTGYYSESRDNGGRKFITVGGSIKYSYIEVNASYALPVRNESTGNVIRVGLFVNI